MKTSINFEITIKRPAALKSLSTEQLTTLGSMEGTLAFGVLKSIFKESLSLVSRDLNNLVPTENPNADAYTRGLKKGEQGNILTILNLIELVNEELRERKKPTEVDTEIKGL